MTGLEWPLWTDVDLTPVALAGLGAACWLLVTLRRRLTRIRKTTLTAETLAKALEEGDRRG